ncbi:hypothetical protein T10_469 [Trichinella papuae]|uniref:PiggyBac transposable element-derived protein domain-containing protein n=1 Tax=Trichinella papuae TaxID=268474 RepID=A0A0V1MS45_9BILA|nr:hypothetical protein T10_469 [Trichinella papuae]
MKFYCEKVGGVSGEIGSTPFCDTTVTIPNIVKSYNINMGGIELSNMLAGLYHIDYECRKWTRCIFSWIICTTMANGW